MRVHRRATVTLSLAVLAAAVACTFGVRALDRASATVAVGSPYGSLDSLTAVPGGAHVRGWTIDPDTASAIKVNLFSDGKLVKSVTASAPRPDVARTYPAAGPNHGYDFTAPIAEGTHTVCTVAVNVARGAARQLGCKRLTYRYSPLGYVDSLTAQRGTLTLAGWTFDPDTPLATLSVTVKIDSTVRSLTANRSRPDVAKVYPAAGALHGYSATIAMTQGTHTVCVSAKNVSYGADRVLLCRTVTLDDSPRVHLSVLSQTPGGLRIAGWAFDPDSPKTVLSITTSIDGKATTLPAKLNRPDVGKAYPQAGPLHGFDRTVPLAQGVHQVCVVANNLSFGSNRAIVCKAVALNFNPSASMTQAVRSSPGVLVAGWALDPDTSAPVSVVFTLDGKRAGPTVAAKLAGAVHSGHNFVAVVPAPNGKHTVCAIAVNLAYGTGNSPSTCKTITLNFNPYGHFDSATRVPGSTSITVTGWTIDPDTIKAITVAVTIDGKAAGTATAAVSRPDVAKAYPGTGTAHGYRATFATTTGEHTLCVTAINTAGGSGNTSQGCRIVNAVHPVVPSAPRSPAAVAGYGGATTTWVAPLSDGGAPWSSFRVTASPGGASVTVSGASRAATVTGLAAKTTYTFSVVAVNVAGASPAAHSPAVTTQPSPPPQTSPAPISTSRYIRNIRGSSATELATMRAEGAADARANPSGHGYLILLDIGGQDQSRGGVLLSATTRFVSYADLVRDLDAYADGYHSQQKPSAPITIAIGTNNDMDVSSTSGATWARSVVNAVLAHAASYTGMTIAGANDIEPGFQGTYTQTQAWLSGYLGATKAPFVFNGSADGCAWTVTNRGCNNGWTMAGLYNLSAGAAPIRIINLPQVYNNTMAAQWKYISLTGVGKRLPKINFGGALTEFTACAQDKGCGSLTGNNAWKQMWAQLQSNAALRIPSLPYSTDLRIDS